MALREGLRELSDDTGRLLTWLGIGGSAVSAVVAAVWYYWDQLATLPAPVPALLVLAAFVLFLVLNAFGVLLSHVYLQRPSENPFRPQPTPRRVPVASTEDFQHKQLVDRAAEVEQLTTDLEQKTLQLDTMTRLRDQALDAWANSRKHFALYRLQEFGRRGKIKRATIRFADYVDFPLVQEIKDLLMKAGWPVELDQSNKPLMEPNSEIKVVIRTKDDDPMMMLRGIFEDGQLIARTGMQRQSLDEDYGHLVVDVLPDTRKA